MFLEGKALEFLIAAVVALVVVGPKDLPILLRKLGQFMARVRAMAAEFRASFDEMARQSELDELRKEVEAMRKGQLSDLAAHTNSPEMTQTFDEISQGLSDVGVSLNSPTAYSYAPAQTEHVDITPIEAPKPKRKASARTKASGKTASATPKSVAAKAAPSKAAPSKAAPSKAVSSKATGPKPAAPKSVVKAAPAPAKSKAPAAKPAATKPRARKASVS